MEEYVRFTDDSGIVNIKEKMVMAQVGIVMGSDSDMPVMAKAAEILDELGISYEMRIISAHREPDVFFEYAKTAEEKGFQVIIAGAGMDSHYSIVQRPSGIPVATVAINGGANAGILAAKILAVADKELLGRLKEYSLSLKESVLAKDAKLQETGYKNYTK